MTTYSAGSTSTSADLLLIPVTYRAAEDLPTIAAVAEADVVERFTQHEPPRSQLTSEFYVTPGWSLGQGDYVALRNFNPDASSCTDAGLVLALKRTIAEVITWRAAKLDENPALGTVTTQAGQVKTKSARFNDPFPPGDWLFRLRRWDLR